MGSGTIEIPCKLKLLIVSLSISFLKSSKIFFMYLGAPMLGAYIFTMFMSSWWILPLSIMKWPSGSLFMALLLKSILSDMSIAISPYFFPCPFSWNICFQPFTFSLCRSFVLRWVSCRQYMCGSWFLIQAVRYKYHMIYLTLNWNIINKIKKQTQCNQRHWN